MFPFGFVLPVSLVLLFSAAAAVFGYIGGGALAFAWVLTFAALLGAMLVIDGHGGLRRTGAGLLAAAALGLALAIGIVPAHATEALVLAPPPGDTGFWGTINGWIANGLNAIVAAAVTALCTVLYAHTRVKLTAAQEEQLRELMKTGAYQGMHEIEVLIDDHWTPAQRQKLVDRMVNWAETRGTAQLKKLGLPSFVVTAMARKVLGQLQGVAILPNDLTNDFVFGGTLPKISGNPGETPALDRVVGPAMGGN